MSIEESTQRHPTDGEMAAYLGRELRGEALRAVESHLAQCAQCREEVMDASDILAHRTRSGREGFGSRFRRGQRILVPLVAAAAALVLFFSWPGDDGNRPAAPIHREAPDEASGGLSLLSPSGATEEARVFQWRRIPGADRYRLTLFEADGTVLWRDTTSDSLLVLPDSLVLTPDQSYLWQVEARVGWDLWESSDLLEFKLEAGSRGEPGGEHEEPSGPGEGP